MEFCPRMGDAIVWSNVDKNGKADPDMIHQGLPPEEGVKMAVNIWLRDEPFTSPQQAMQAAAQRQR
jgi:prolyl 4-hydroxylase